MAFFLFIDESGQDHHDSSYEVLVGIAIDDKNLWNFIRSAQELEINFCEELNKYLDLIKPMRYRTTRKIGDISEYVI